MRKREYPRHHWPFRASKVPSQPTGWSAQTHPRGVSPIPALEVCHFIRLNEALEHLVRKHAPAQSEANKIFRALQKSVVDQLCNRAAEIIDRRLAELSGQIPQVDTSREAQSKKEAFFQRSLPRDNGPLQRRSGNVSFQRIGAGEAYRVGVRRGRCQHRMRIHAKTQVRVPRPLFQVMPRLESIARNVAYLLLRDSSRLELFTSREIEIGDDIVVGHKMCVITRATCHQFASQSRIFIHLHPVNAHMSSACSNALRQRRLPTVRRLMVETSDH